MVEIATPGNKKKFSLGRWLGIAALILLVVFVSFLVWLFQSTRSPYGTTDSLELVHIEIAGHHFAIPKAYISLRSNWKGGSMTGVLMTAVLPDLKPYGEETKTEFERLGYGNKVDFSIHTRGSRLLSVQELFEHERKNAIDEKDVEGPFRFRLYKLRGSVAKELLFRNLEDGSFIFLECVASGAAVSPSCSRDVYVNDDYYIHYSYSRDYLKDWQKIDQDIRNLIHSFELASSTATRTEDKK